MPSKADGQVGEAELGPADDLDHRLVEPARRIVHGDEAAIGDVAAVVGPS
jgi:hypothetical protein